MDAKRRSGPVRGVVAVMAAALCISCGGGGTPAPPAPSAPAGATTVTGRERIGWGFFGDPGNVRFRAFVDGTPVDLPQATCTPQSEGHECVSPLPALTNGLHVLTVAAVAGDLESERSEQITVFMTGRTSATASALAVSEAGAGATPLVAPLMVDLPWPVQLASLPEGRLLIGQGDGRVHLVDPAAPEGAVLALDAGALFDPPPVSGLSVTAGGDPGQRHVFVSYVSRDAAGTPRLSVVRMREVGGRLGEPRALLDTVLATDDARADAARSGTRLAASPEGGLVVLLPDGLSLDAHPAASRDVPTVIRLRADGRTPTVDASNDGGVAAPWAMALPGADAEPWFFGLDGRVSIPAPHQARMRAAVASEPLFEPVLADGEQRMRLPASAVAAWQRVDGAAMFAAAGTLRTHRPLDLTAVVPGLTGLVEDVVYADGQAFVVTRHPGASTASVVRVSWPVVTKAP